MPFKRVRQGEFRRIPAQIRKIYKVTPLTMVFYEFHLSKSKVKSVKLSLISKLSLIIFSKTFLPQDILRSRNSFTIKVLSISWAGIITLIIIWVEATSGILTFVKTVALRTSQNRAWRSILRMDTLTSITWAVFP